MGNVTGGINIPESIAITEEHKKMVEEVRKDLIDSSKVTPLALLGTQVVAGMNYWILCKAQLMSPGGEEKLVVYKIYCDPQNKVSLSEVNDFQF